MVDRDATPAALRPPFALYPPHEPGATYIVDADQRYVGQGMTPELSRWLLGVLNGAVTDVKELRKALKAALHALRMVDTDSRIHVLDNEMWTMVANARNNGAETLAHAKEDGL